MSPTPLPRPRTRWKRIEPGFYVLQVYNRNAWHFEPTGWEVAAGFSHTRADRGEGWNIRGPGSGTGALSGTYEHWYLADAKADAEARYRKSVAA